jgi:hypothetical protein
MNNIRSCLEKNGEVRGGTSKGRARSHSLQCRNSSNVTHSTTKQQMLLQTKPSSPQAAEVKSVIIPNLQIRN